MPLSLAVFSGTLKAPGAWTSMQILQKILYSAWWTVLSTMGQEQEWGRSQIPQETEGGMDKKTDVQRWSRGMETRITNEHRQCLVPHHDIHWLSRQRTAWERWIGESDSGEFSMKDCLFLCHVKTCFWYLGGLVGRGNRVLLYSPLEFTSCPGWLWNPPVSVFPSS